MTSTRTSAQPCACLLTTPSYIETSLPPSDTDQLKSDLEKLSNWEKKWQMGFNVNKCNSLTLSLKRKLIEKTYILNNQHLDRVNNAKYLGITISKNLNWKAHINNIAAEANKASAFVHRN